MEGGEVDIVREVVVDLLVEDYFSPNIEGCNSKALFRRLQYEERYIKLYEQLAIRHHLKVKRAIHDIYQSHAIYLVDGKEEDINSFEDEIDGILYQNLAEFYMNIDNNGFVSAEIWVLVKPYKNKYSDKKTYTKRFAEKVISELAKKHNVRVDYSGDVWVDFGSGKEIKVLVRGKVENVNQYIKELNKQVVVS